MHCPFCNHEETKVNDSRLAGEGQQIRRRRECLQCGERFTTFETAELVLPRVVKSDASREPFDEVKLRSSLLKALEKRPVASEALDAAVVHISHKLRALGEREVPSRQIGELAMEELRHLDEVAYVRFASVYRSFQDVDAFREEIERLKHRPTREAGKSQLPLWEGGDAKKENVMFTELDKAMMVRALAQAERGLYTTDPNPRVGCVLARGDQVVGEGYTSPVGGPHAEVHALRAAGEQARGATAYVTLEPCSHHGRTPPCSDALIAAGVARVIYAIGDPNPQVNGGGADSLRQAGIDVASGLLAAEAREINIGFFTRMTTSMPWVTVKQGVSLDGKVALANGVSQWITSAASRADVQRQRARSSVIMTGVGTVLTDDPRLTVRADDIDMLGRHPLRVICDSQLRTPPSARLFKEPGAIAILTTCEDEVRIGALIAAGAEVLQVARNDGHVDLHAVLQLLATRGCNEVLVEAGPELSGSLVEQRLVNELLIYMAPMVLGSEARSMLQLPSLTTMEPRWNFTLYECQKIGSDLRLRYRNS